MLYTCTCASITVCSTVRPLGQCVCGCACVGVCVCVCVWLCVLRACAYVPVCVCVGRRQTVSVRAGGVLYSLLAHLQSWQTGKHSGPVVTRSLKQLKMSSAMFRSCCPAPPPSVSIHYLLASLSASRGGESY